MNTIKSILDWFKIARPNVNAKHLHTQMGVHFEEVSEMLAEITGLNDETSSLIAEASLACHKLAEHLKANDSVVRINLEDRKNYLDALCDQIVTAVGCAHDQKMDISGALDEVDRSNYSKFVNGEAIFDGNGKIAKGLDYFKADLRKYI
jgi:predicted HAD superfamily Cof-like phosphohydrolase